MVLAPSSITSALAHKLLLSYLVVDQPHDFLLCNTMSSLGGTQNEIAVCLDSREFLLWHQIMKMKCVFSNIIITGGFKLLHFNCNSEVQGFTSKSY